MRSGAQGDSTTARAPSNIGPILNQSQLPPSDIASDVAFISELYASGGPERSDYDEFNRWLGVLYRRYDSGHVDDSAVNTIRHAMPRAWTPETCQGRAYSKLHGYAGDYEIIDWIYQRHTTSSTHLARWDDYFHQCEAPTAVRNRKAFFKTALAQRLEEHSSAPAIAGPMRVLDLASGPCRDVAEFFDANPDADVDLVCVDQDVNAIRYARGLCHEYLSHIEFVQKNVFRYRTKQRFDWIWSAGLFDYLEDEIFCKLLRRLGGLAAPGGQIVIGNFSETNPSFDFMRFGEWHLNHRSAELLVRLAKRAGYDDDQVSVQQESLGVNLFLTIDLPEDRSPSSPVDPS